MFIFSDLFILCRVSPLCAMLIRTASQYFQKMEAALDKRIIFHLLAEEKNACTNISQATRAPAKPVADTGTMRDSLRRSLYEHITNDACPRKSLLRTLALCCRIA